MIAALKRIFCTHRFLHVIRWHRNCVTREMRGKELYIDVHRVHCFVQCCRCKRIFNTDQREYLFAMEKTT